MSSPTAQKAIKISYTMSPPSDLPLDASEPLPISKSHIFSISSSTSSQAEASSASTTIPDQNPNPEKAYYKSLLSSLGDAKDTVGEELTKWRDVIGKREAMPIKPEDDEDEEGDSEE